MHVKTLGAYLLGESEFRDASLSKAEAVSISSFGHRVEIHRNMHVETSQENESETASGLGRPRLSNLPLSFDGLAPLNA
jgi:hypothetical protein